MRLLIIWIKVCFSIKGSDYYFHFSCFKPTDLGYDVDLSFFINGASAPLCEINLCLEKEIDIDHAFLKEFVDIHRRRLFKYKSVPHFVIDDVVVNEMAFQFVCNGNDCRVRIWKDAIVWRYQLRVNQWIKKDVVTNEFFTPGLFAAQSLVAEFKK